MREIVSRWSELNGREPTTTEEFHAEELLEAVLAEREACAKIAETMDYSVTDLGPAEPAKVFSGVTTVDNRSRETPGRIAAAIRARKD